MEVYHSLKHSRRYINNQSHQNVDFRKVNGYVLQVRQRPKCGLQLTPMMCVTNLHKLNTLQ